MLTTALLKRRKRHASHREQPPNAFAGYLWWKPCEANCVAIRSRERVRHFDHRRRLALEIEEAEL